MQNKQNGTDNPEPDRPEAGSEDRVNDSGGITPSTSSHPDNRSNHQASPKYLIELNDLLQNVVSNSPIGLFFIDRQGMVLLSTGKGLEDLNKSRESIVGKSIFDVYRNSPIIIQNFHRALQGEHLRVIVEIGEFTFDTQYTPFWDENREIMGVFGIATDITQHRETENALFSSQKRFQTIFEESELGIALEDLHGKVIESNPAFQEILGYTAEELSGKTFTEFTHPADLGTNIDLYEAITSGARESFRLDKRYIRKDGRTIWGRLTTSLMRGPDGKPEAVIAMVEDITTKKQLEAELFEVQHRLMQGREQERLRLAQEIHDGPLQDMYAIVFKLKELETELNAQEPSELLQQIQNDVQRQVQALRSICGELRPPSLAPFGLEKAIRSHIDQFKALHPELKIDLEIKPDGQRLPEPVRMVLFRIYQELLNNIVRHAKATSISIRFQVLENRAWLEVADNGQGFTVPLRWVDMARQNHLGLIGARERAESIGGTLEVWSSPGEGTRVRVTVPRSLGEVAMSTIDTISPDGFKPIV